MVLSGHSANHRPGPSSRPGAESPGKRASAAREESGTMNFHGKVLQGNQIVLFEVAGEMLHQGDPGTALGWAGSFTTPADQPIQTGRYRLVLDDGRSMDILVHRAEPRSDQGTVAHFMTTGTVQIRVQPS